MPFGLFQNFDGPSLCLAGDLPVRCPVPQPMHHDRIATLVHPQEQLAHPTVGHPHLAGSFALSDHAVLGPFQPFQLVAFLLAHLDSFHPSALRLSRGTFYLAQLGTFTWPRQFGLSFRILAASMIVSIPCFAPREPEKSATIRSSGIFNSLRMGLTFAMGRISETLTEFGSRTIDSAGTPFAQTFASIRGEIDDTTSTAS